jgi:hypothetical protein
MLRRCWLSPRRPASWIAATRRSTGGLVQRNNDPTATISGKRRPIGRVLLPCFSAIKAKKSLIGAPPWEWKYPMKALFAGLIALALITGAMVALSLPMSEGTARLVKVQTQPTFPN